MDNVSNIKDELNIDTTDIGNIVSSTVARIIYPRSYSEILEIVRLANKLKKSISICGESHSMGGQTFKPNTILINMKMINDIKYDSKTTDVTCGAGTTWRQLIEHINEYGRTPISLQSYSTFSIGGSISVNAHGILNKNPVSDGIVKMIILTNIENKIAIKNTKMNK